MIVTEHSWFNARNIRSI